MIPAEHSDDGDDLDERRATQRAGLRPFRAGDPRAVEAGRKGGQARRVRSAAERAARLGAVEHLTVLRDTFDRGQLGDLAAAAAMWTIGEVVSGRQRVRDPAAWVKVLVDVARLEAGEATSTSAVVHVQGDDIIRARELRDLARRALDVAEVVDDGPSSQ